MKMSVLEAKNLFKNFGDVEVLKDINLAIDEGDFLVLVGPSGCGKSTLLNITAGLEEMSSGDIMIDDAVVNEVPPKDRDIAMVFQSYALYPTMTVEKNITFGMKVRKVPAAKRKEALDRVAGLLAIDHLLDRKPSQLSGGQRQRVAMGRALVRQPRIFLFDEPLSNLDAKLRIQMRAEIKQLHQRLGTTIVYVTHDQTEAMSLATKIAVMNGGIIEQLGAPQELYDRPTSIFVADFIGSPAMNFVKGHLKDVAGECRFVTEHEGNEVSVPVGHYEFAATPSEGQDVILGLRPEYITSNTSDHHGAASLDFELTPKMMETTGFDQHVVFDFCGGEIAGRFSSKVDIKIDQPMTVHMDLSTISFFDSNSERRI
jgi:multiple sugar transport system ATP-binding protein